MAALSEEDEDEDAEEDELAGAVCLAVVDCAWEADAGALLAGCNVRLELLLALFELLLDVVVELVEFAAALVFEPAVVAPLDLPGKACAATSARSAVSARLPAISQRLARPRRRRAASRVWVVCWRIVTKGAASVRVEGGAADEASLRPLAKRRLTAALESSSNLRASIRARHGAYP